MDTNKFRSKYLLISFAILKILCGVNSEFGNQPKIRTHDGTLILEPAWDKNITLRLTHDSDLYFGDVNVLDELRQLAMQQNVHGGNEVDYNSDTDTWNHPTTVDETLYVNRLSVEVGIIKRDLRRLNKRISLAQNRTAGQQQRIRRFLGRMQRVETSFYQIESALQVEECETNAPCKNGGTCFNTYKSFYCECPDEWTGKTCEEDVDECYILTGTDLGCQNNGACINILGGGYRCACPDGYTGTHCHIKNATCETAQSAEICGHGTCVHANNNHGYSCICDQGWTKNNATPACIIDVDECESNTNPCRHGCINLPGSFKCEPCPHGYSGNGVSCTDIDECAANNGGCSLLPTVQCINTEGSYHCGNCPPGYIGDGRNCEEQPSNSCDALNICHERAKCEKISGTVVCTCPLGWFGHGFGAHGCSINGNMTDPCANHVCKNNGTCVVSGRGTLCICQRGFMGALCDEADACQAHPCQNGGTCKLLPGNRFSCTCERGTTGKKCEIQREICGSVLRQETGSLDYPPAGDHYESFESCAWMIRTRDMKVINVTFSKFDLEEPEKAGADCNKDWLQIHDGRALSSPLIGRFCGKTIPLNGNFLSSNQQLLFWFRSDNLTHGGGFSISWTSEAHTCGGLIDLDKDQTGVIRSPGYPGKVEANRNCEWQLIAPFGYRIILRIYEVILGKSGADCNRDTFNIFDSDLLLKKICETAQPAPMHTSSNKATIRLHTDNFLADSAFQLHYEVVPGAPHCGGLFTEPKGTIVGFMNAPLCEYLIQLPPDMRIELVFLSLNLWTSNNCEVHQIEVFDGKTENDPLIKRLCGSQLPEPLVSSSNFMLLRYKFLVGLPIFKEFKASYKSVCGGRFFGPEGGILATPNYPNPYFDHITCSYEIYGPRNHIVHANFTDFSMSETIPSPMDFNGTNDTSVYGNFVEVFLSDDDKRVFYKGAPMQLVSETNRMRIVFHSSVNSKKARGLRVEYDFERTRCGGVLTKNEDMFNLFGVGQRTSMYCEWIIEAPVNNHINLKLKHIQYDTSCADHSVSIYANYSNGESSLLRRICGEDVTIDEPIYANVATIILHIPGTKVVHLYDMTVSYSFSDNTEHCGGNFKSRSGVIQSPNWPKYYLPSSDCTWHIEAPLGHQLELIVRNFSLEHSSPLCQDDYLEIRNGGNKNSPLIGRFCGTTIPTRIPSFTNRLYLHFASDKYIEEDGFDITWQQTMTGCGGTLNSYTGTIHPPSANNYGRITCDWHIYVAAGSTIELTLSDMDKYLDVCQMHTILNVYDGPSTTSRLLPWNCTTASNNTLDTLTLKSTKNKMLIRYQNEQANKFFLLEYKTICNNVLLDSLFGVIETPNFPDLYPSNMHCKWDIHSGRNNKISLVFSHFSVEERNSACETDYVELLDMRDDVLLTTKRICTQPLQDIVSEGNRFVVKFVSDYSENSRGFRLEYKRLGCGQYLRQNVGSFETPNIPYSIDMDCDWFIEVPAGKLISLIFSEVQITSDVNNCTQNALIVTESRDSNITLLRECRTDRKLIRLTSPANQLFIHFHTNEKRVKKYFRASFFYTEAKCGGIFSSASGTITNPNYPELATDIECVWNIAVENNFGLVLEFTELGISETENCQDAYIEIRTLENTDQNYTVLERICASDIKRKRDIQSSSIRVALFVKNTAWAKFVLNYQKQCGGEITVPTGILRAEPNLICQWHIRAPEGALIGLNIQNFECNCEYTAKCGLNIGYDRTDLEDLRHYTCNSSFTHTYFSDENFYIGAMHVHFLASFSILENRCGAIITSLTGVLTSPTYRDGGNTGEIECVWQIVAKTGNAIVLNLFSLDIAYSTHCNEDFLEIRTAEVGGKLLGLFCGNELPDQPLISQEQVWLKYKIGVSKNSGKGFNLSWAYEHLNEFNSTNGSIESPPVYAARTQEDPYQWRILAERGEGIVLNFKSYSNGLKIYDGFDDSALIVDPKYSPWTFYSSSNALFLSTVNADLEHFLVDWKVVSLEAVAANTTIKKCHETIIIPASGSVNISSPGFPFGYETVMNCEWVLKPVDVMRHVVFDLYEVDLENTNKCSADYVSVSTSSDLTHWQDQLTRCTSPPIENSPFNVIHGEPYVKVNFVSDMSVNGTGFTSLAHTSCGSNITASIGTILGDYQYLGIDFNDNCSWHIAVHPGKRIQFLFEYGDTRESKKNENCNQYALIYDGLDMNAPILPPGQICNHPDRNTKMVETTSNHAVVFYKMLNNFNNIHKFEGHFWNLTFREFSDCDGEIVLTHMASWVNISSPRHPNIPNPHTECNWIIVAPPGEVVRAEFIGRIDFNLRYCDKEFIEFHDGSTILARGLGRFCRRSDTILSTGNVLHVRYLTDIAEPHTGFQLNVSIALCGGTTNAISGDLQSPHYPALGAYSKASICEWTIVLMKNMQVHLNFLDINLPYDSKNIDASDRLEIVTISDDNVNTIETYFGNLTQMPRLDVNSNKVTIRLRSLALDNSKYRGFKVRYTRSYNTCNRHYSDDNGHIVFERPERNQQNCRWFITVTKGLRVSFKVTKFIGSAVHNRTQPSVMSTQLSFFNDLTLLSPITTLNFDEINNTQVISSTDNFMLVNLNIGQGAVVFDRIEAVYYADGESECPPDIPIESKSGELILQSRPYNFYCSMYFELNGKETITFKIDELEIEKMDIFVTYYAIRFRNEDLQVPFTVLKTNVSQRLISYSPRRGSVNWVQNNYTHLNKFVGSYYRNPCGGTYLVTEELVIDYPNINVPVSNPLECVWTLRSGVKKIIFKLQGTATFADSCDREYIALHSGNTAHYAEVARICRDTPTYNGTLLQRVYTLMIYHTENYKRGQSSFHFLTENRVYCGSKISVTKISNPITIDSKSYNNNYECSWEFQANEGFFLSLEFKNRFFLEYSENCTADYFEVLSNIDDIWTSIYRLCGRDVQKIYNISSNHIMVNFRTNENVTAEGFSFVVFPHCEAVFNVTESTQLLRVPVFSIAQRYTMQCNFIFQSNSDKMINLRIRTMENNHKELLSCPYVRFAITRKNGRKDTQDYCNPVNIRDKEFIKVQYTSHTSQSFTIEYDLNTCGGNITTPETIQSVQNMNSDTYIDYMSCIWYVTAPPEHTVIIRFKYFDMEKSSDCSLDYVAVYKGHSQIDDKRVTKICGNLTSNPPLLVIDSNQAVIAAKSDISQSEKGFHAYVGFIPNCNERIMLSDGNSPVTLSRQFKVNGTDELICSYRVLAPKGYRVSIQIRELELNMPTCSACETCNHIELHDSTYATGASMGKFCANGRTDVKLFSSYEDAVVKLSAKHAGEYSFEIIFQMEPTTCGQTDFNLVGNNAVQIQFPKSGNENYLPNTHCTWRFDADGAFSFHLTSYKLQNVSQVTGNCSDYIQILGDYVSHRICGHGADLELYFSVGKMSYADLTFHSDDSIEDQGFNVTIRHRSACNRTYTALSGELYYDSSNSVNHSCIDEIRVPENYVITLVVSTEIYDQRKICESVNPNLKIIDMKTNATLKEGCKDSYQDDQIYTSTNAVRVEIKSYAIVKIFYFVNSRTAPLGCGGKIVSISGEFKNPPYNDHNSSECRWEISVPPPNAVVLNLHTFDMGSKSNCHLNYINIFEISPDNTEKLVRNFCGLWSDISDSFFKLTTSRIAVVAKKSPNFDGTGFMISFDMDESPRLWLSNQILNVQFP